MRWHDLITLAIRITEKTLTTNLAALISAKKETDSFVPHGPMVKASGYD